MGAARVDSFSATRLREIRLSRRLSQTGLAAAIPGWRKSDVWRYEHGVRAPSARALHLLAGALDVIPSALTSVDTGPTLTDLRQVAGLTRAEASAASGLTVQQLATLECGRGRITDHAAALAAAFQATSADVLAAHARPTPARRTSARSRTTTPTPP